MLFAFRGDQGFFRLKRNLQRGLVLDDCHFGVPDIAFENRIVPANLERCVAVGSRLVVET